MQIPEDKTKEKLLKRSVKGRNQGKKVRRCLKEKQRNSEKRQKY